MYGYSLKKNPLTDKTGDFVAVVQNGKKMSIEEIVEEIAIPGSIIKKTELVAVINVFFETLAKKIRKGVGFNSEYLQTSVSITGTFESDEEKFDKSKHKVKVNFTPGPGMKKLVGDIAVEKVKAVVITPELDKFIDVTTDTVNGTIMPNSPAKLLGERLKFDPNDPTQGIFFKGENGEETKVALVIHNMPSQLIFMVPALTQGIYKVQVRAMINGTEVREGTLLASLTVA